MEVVVVLKQCLRIFDSLGNDFLEVLRSEEQVGEMEVCSLLMMIISHTQSKQLRGMEEH